MALSLAVTLIHVPEQSTVPVGHVQTLAVHTLPPEQMRPQAPQLRLSEARLVSQPLVVLLSQLPKPAVHVPSRQEPVTQVAVALGKTQGRPQPPQWLVLLEKSASQPLATLVSQSPYPAPQSMRTHTPPAHVGVPLVLLHARPHAPQFVAEVASVVSQLPLPSQSAEPGMQMLRPHMPMTQVAARPVMLGQTVPHMRQLVVSVLRLVSQPLLGSRSQSPKPGVHGPMVHAPATQLAVALAKRQRLLQAPQLLGSVLVLVSQPAALLQSPKPGRQAVGRHMLDTQLPKALGIVVSQLVLHAPQLPPLVIRSTHTGVIEPTGMQAVWPVGQRHTPLEQN